MSVLTVHFYRILWFEGRVGSAIDREPSYTLYRLLRVSTHVRRYHVRLPSLFIFRFDFDYSTRSPILAIGAVAERSRLGPLMVFVFIWSTIVYNAIACWTWNSNGWAFVLGGLDFAGGTPVHISSGTAGLAISIYLGKRRGWGTERLAYKPHNTSYVILGTVFLWFGWFGFNGGSALSANLRAAQACIVTNLAASVGGLTWMLWDYRLERKWSAVGFCSGAISGLVAITPASGFVGSREFPPDDRPLRPLVFILFIQRSRRRPFRRYGRYHMQLCHPTQIPMPLRRRPGHLRLPRHRRRRRQHPHRAFRPGERSRIRWDHRHPWRVARSSLYSTWVSVGGFYSWDVLFVCYDREFYRFLRGFIYLFIFIWGGV